jgi:hypothetical protein
VHVCIDIDTWREKENEIKSERERGGGINLIYIILFNLLYLS